MFTYQSFLCEKRLVAVCMALSMKYENPRFKDIFLIRSHEGQLRSVHETIKETLPTTVKYCVTYSNVSHALSRLAAVFMEAISSLKYGRGETLELE